MRHAVNWDEISTEELVSVLISRSGVSSMLWDEQSQVIKVNKKESCLVEFKSNNKPSQI